MYAIAGNHDVVMRKGSIPPQVIFKKMGLKVISTINPTYMHEDIFIAGLPYYPASHGKSLKNKLAELSEKATHHDKSILVLHQGIDKYFSLSYELEIGELEYEQVTGIRMNGKSEEIPVDTLGILLKEVLELKSIVFI